MTRTNTKRIPRGLQSVRAEATDDVPTLVRSLNAAFAEFKAKHTQDVKNLQGAVDDMALHNAARQMNGDGYRSKDGDEPVHAAAGLRGTKAIAKHFMERGKEKGEAGDVSLASMMRGIAGMKTTDAAMASLSEGTDSSGGYAVPNVVMPGILDALAEQSALLRAGASILPIGGAKSVTTAGIDTLPTPAWRQELGAIAESAPTFRAVVQTPRSLACIVRISRELLADATDMDRAIRTAIAQAFAAELDRVGLVGSGTAPEPLGIQGIAGVNTFAQAGAAFAYRDLLTAYQTSLDHRAPAPTSAIVAPRTLINLAALTDTTGQPLSSPALLDGVSMLPTTGVPVDLGAGDNESLAFVGDFRVVQFGMREALSIQPLREAYGKTGEIGFLCHLRADVAVLYPSAITVITGVK